MTSVKTLASCAVRGRIAELGRGADQRHRRHLVPFAAIVAHYADLLDRQRDTNWRAYVLHPIHSVVDPALGVQDCNVWLE